MFWKKKKEYSINELIICKQFWNISSATEDKKQYSIACDDVELLEVIPIDLRTRSWLVDLMGKRPVKGVQLPPWLIKE